MDALPAIGCWEGAPDEEHAISQTLNTTIAVIGIDIGKNSFHIVGHDGRGAIVLHRCMEQRRAVRCAFHDKADLAGMRGLARSDRLEPARASLPDRWVS